MCSHLTGEIDQDEKQLFVFAFIKAVVKFLGEGADVIRYSVSGLGTSLILKHC